MSNLFYKIEFYDYWGTSSGLSGGALADNLCLKDKMGLPYLPGKTIKGLFREAAETLQGYGDKSITDKFIYAVFGQREHDPGDSKAEEKTEIAVSFFTNATLNRATADTITKELSPFLFEQIASTALEENGMADKHSLRRIEYALPCTLFGEILEVDDSDKNPLQVCASFIKRLGINRHHGYGRCKISFL